jgi:plastocyanin
MNRLSPRIAAAALIALVAATGAAHAALFIGVASDRDGQALPNAVIALKPIGVTAAATAPATITVTQEGLAFKPYVTVIRSGSSVVFANRDQVEHHIKSFSSSKPFEIAVHKPGDTPAPIRFEKEGAVVAYCILHDWMRAYVYVADTPWFAVSGDNGLARVDNIPPGEYEVAAWHPDLGQYKPPLMSKVTVAATGTTQSTIKFDFKPRAIRQAPKTGGVKTAELHKH